MVVAIGWLGLRSDYEFATYPVDGCAQSVTAVTYWKLFHRGRWFTRGVAFVPGTYRTREIPNHDCLILPELSGFDAYFEVIPTCENGAVILTSHYIPLESPTPSKALISRAIRDNPSYQEFRRNNVGNIIKLE